MAGSPFVFVVTAEDQFNYTVTGYSGTLHFASSDGQAVVQGNATLIGGVGFFAAVLKTAGNQTLTAVDITNSSIAGTSAAIAVTGLAANHFVVSAPLSAVTGTQFIITVTAEDQFNNLVYSYGGTVLFASSDGLAALPGNSTLTGGIGTFSVTLNSPGNHTLSVTDTVTSSVNGTSNFIVSRGLTVTSLTPTSTGFVAIFDKPFVVSDINLYDSTSGGGIDDVLLTGTPAGAPQVSYHGSLIISPTDQTITFIKTSNFTGVNFNPASGVLAAGTYTVTFRSATNGFVDSLNGPLDGANNGNPAGSNYVATFVVAAPPTIVAIPAFARGPDSVDTIELPNTATTGIPLNVSVGSGITSGNFTLQYNPALLSISGASVNTGLTGASLSLDAASTTGTAILDFSSPTALTQTGAVRLGGLVATVPATANSLYRSKALLHWSGVTLNGGAINAEGGDAVEIVAYFGDASGTANGSLSGGDASDISAVATGISTNSTLGTLGGFSAFPLGDPVIIADLNNDGLVDASDVTLLNSVLSGTPRTQIPTIPTNVAITAYGPDPLLSLPAALTALPGGTVVVPVDIDTARPVGSTGAVEAILALRYDPKMFTVSAADVQLGSLTSGWQLTAVVNAQTGEIGIDLFSSTPIQTTGGGSLVEIVGSGQWAVGSNAGPAVWLVNQVDPTGHRVFTTTVADGQGAFVLQMNSGQWVLGSGQLAVPNTSMAPSETASNTQFAAHSPLATPHYLELVYSEMALPSGMALEAVMGQPVPALDFDESDDAAANPNRLTSPPQANGITHIDWPSDGYLAYLRSDKQAVWASDLGWLDLVDGEGID